MSAKSNRATVIFNHYRFTVVKQHGQILLEIERNIHSQIYREKVPIYLTPPQAQQLEDLIASARESTEQSIPLLPSRLQKIAANVRARFRSMSPTGLGPGGETR